MENNKLIAEFMQLPSQGMGDGLHRLYEDPFSGEYTEDLKYHCSWDWLMPVVEKIKDCNLLSGVGMNINIYNTVTEIKCRWKGNIITINSHKTRIQATYSAVIDFIKWYNQQ